MKLQLAAGGALAALLCACGSAPVSYGDPYYGSGYQSSGYYGDRYAYNRYNDWTVTSIEVMDGRRVGDAYRVTVRGPGGNYETYYMDSLSGLRVGDRVRVANGTIYSIG